MSSFEGSSITPASSEVGNDFDTRAWLPHANHRVIHLSLSQIGCGCITDGLLIMPVIRTFVTERNTSCPFSDSSSQRATLRTAQNYRAITSAIVLETLPDPQYITFYRTMQSSRPFERPDFLSWIGCHAFRIRSRHQFDVSALWRAKMRYNCYAIPPFSPSNRLRVLFSGAQRRFCWRKVLVPRPYAVCASMKVGMSWMTPGRTMQGWTELYLE